MELFAPRQSKIGKGEGIEAETSQVEFKAPQKTKPKTILSRKEEREISKKKAAKGKREYGLEAFGVEKEGQSSLRKFFVNPVLLLNPRGMIGDPANPIMRIQLLNLWKRALGAEDLGDFTTFMKEVSDLTYHEAKDKLIKTYGKPKGKESDGTVRAGIQLHEGMCDYAQDQCIHGDMEACKVACEECSITDACLQQGPVQKPRKAPETKPIEEIHRHVKTKPKAKSSITKRIPPDGIVKITRADMTAGRIVLRW